MDMRFLKTCLWLFSAKWPKLNLNHTFSIVKSKKENIIHASVSLVKRLPPPTPLWMGHIIKCSTKSTLLKNSRFKSIKSGNWDAGWICYKYVLTFYYDCMLILTSKLYVYAIPSLTTRWLWSLMTFTILKTCHDNKHTDSLFLKLSLLQGVLLTT